MEFLIYYIIVAISFGIMFTYRYGYTVTLNILQLANIMDIDYTETRWDPIAYMIAFLLVSIIAMPSLMFRMLTTKRRTLVKTWTARVLERDFGLTKL